MESKELVKNIVTSLNKHKAVDIKVIGIRDLSVIADYFIIASGTSSTQVKSLADYVEVELGEKNVKPVHVEGPATNWILIDYSNVLVHVFYTETRSFYDLERLWKDGELLPLSDFIEEDQQ